MNEAASPRIGEFWRNEALLRNVFIFSLFCGIFLPSIGTFAGLKIRANQPVLAIVVPYVLIFRRPRWRLLPAYAAPMAFVWLTFLFWTTFHIARGTLTLWPGESPVGSVGRCFLVGINFITYGAAYLLMLRCGDPARIINALVLCGAAMGVFGLLVFIAYQRGIPLPPELVSPGGLEPVLRNNVLVGEEITRQYAGPIKGTYLAGMTIVCLMMATRPGARRRGFYIACGAMCATGVVIGISRGAILGVLTGAVVLLATFVMWRAFLTVIRGVLIGAGIVVLGWVALDSMPDRGGQTAAAFLGRLNQLQQMDAYSEGTAGQRLELWGKLLNDMRENPFLGNGMDAYERYYPVGITTTESFLLEVFHATGVWGLVPLLCVIWGLWWRCWRLSLSPRLDRDQRSMIAALLAGYVAVFTGALTNSLWGGALFWALLGFLAGGADLCKASLTRRFRGDVESLRRRELPVGVRFARRRAGVGHHVSPGPNAGGGVLGPAGSGAGA